MPKLSYNGQQVYDHDYDRFLTVLFAPALKREALFALYAFNYEIAKTRDVVTDHMIGQIRLQWWRDAIDKLYDGKVLEHEVLQGLDPVIKTLNRADFYTLIDAREQDLEEEAPQTLDDLIIYADQTTTPLNRLACQIIGEEVEEKVLQAVSIAYALAGILRSVPYHVGQGRFLLPLDLLQKYEVSPTKLNSENAAKKLKPIVQEVYNKILNYIDSFSSQKSNSVLLSGVLAKHYARAIKRHDFNIFNEIKVPLAIWHLTWAHLFKQL